MQVLLHEKKAKNDVVTCGQCLTDADITVNCPKTSVKHAA